MIERADDVMPLTAFAPDISGVCSVGGTRPISSTPRNVDSVKMTMAMTRASVDMISAPTWPACVTHIGPVISSSRSIDDLAILDQVLQQRQHVAAEHLARMQRHGRRQVERAEDGHAVGA